MAATARQQHTTMAGRSGPGTDIYRRGGPRASTVDGLGDAIGRAGRGFHAPVQVVGVGADEVDAPDGLEQRRPELRQLPDWIRGGLAGRRPRVLDPDVDLGFLDVLGLAD